MFSVITNSWSKEANMDLTPLRFPHIADKLLEYLDNQNLVKFRLINRTWSNFIDDMTLTWKPCPWNRIMEMYHENTNEWRTFLTNCQTSYGIFADYTRNKMLQEDWEKWVEGKLDLTPLHIAAITGQIEKFLEIFNEIGEKNPGDFRQTTVLHIIAAKGYQELCEMIMREIIAKNPKNVYNVVPLHLAAKNGHYEICRLILDNVMNVTDETNLVPKDHLKYHDSPFYLALTSGHLNICQLFIEYGKYYSIEDWIFVMKENQAFKPEILVMAVTTLLKKGQRGLSHQSGYFRFFAQNIFWYQNDPHKLTMCQLVLEKMKHINSITQNKPIANFESMTPLHYAAKEGDFDLCKQILKYAVDKNPRDLFKRTPLHMAAKAGHFLISELIIHNVLMKNPAGLHGNTPLHLAAQNNHLSVCKLIVENIIEKNPLNSNNESPLDLAKKSGNSEVVSFLQKHKLEEP